MKINQADIHETYHQEVKWYVIVKMGNPHNEAEYVSENFDNEADASRHLKKVCKIFENHWV